MGLFDGQGFSMNWSDPNTMALLGMIQGLGQAAMPSRLPVPNGAVFGALAGGAMQGAKSAYDLKKEEYQSKLYEAQAEEAKRKAGVLGKFNLDSIFGAKSEATGVAPPDPGAAPAAFGALAPSAQPVGASLGPGGLGSLSAAVEQVESGSNPRAVSPKGAIGLRQIMPSTAAQYGVTNPQDLFNPDTNRKVGDTILSDLLGRYNGDVDAALVAYNAGPGRADKWLQAGRDMNVLPAETRAYLPKVKGLLAQAGGGAPGGGPPAMPPGGLAPPMAVAPGMGAVNIDPLALAKQRAILGLGGISGDPLSGFAQAYYNSPQYKGAVAGAEKGATLPLDLQYAGPLAGAKAGAEFPYQSQLKTQEANAALRNQLAGLGLQLTDKGEVVQIPGFVPGQAALAGGRAAAERGVTEPSDIRIAQGKEGFRQVPLPEGGYRLEPVPGGPQAKAEQEKELAKRQQGDIVTQDIGRALKLSGSWTTGFPGSRFRAIQGTEAFDLASLLDTIKANVGFERLQQMRSQSPTGGALGPVSDMENKLLQATLGSLDQSQSRAQFEQNLTRLKEVFHDTVYGSAAQLDALVRAGRITPAQREAALAERARAGGVAPANGSGVTSSGVRWSVK